MKAIIFDFDGTMIDTESVWYEKSKELLEKDYGFELPIEKFATFIGTTDTDLFHYYKSQVKGSFISEEFERKLSKLVRAQVNDLEMRPGFLRFFEETKSMGLKIGLATSSERAWVEPFLQRFNILNDFDVICTKDDVSKVKPDPELYRLAVTKLRINANEAVAIEDSVNGTMSALEAGLHCLVIPNPVTKHLAFHEKVKVYDDFDKIQIKEL